MVLLNYIITKWKLNALIKNLLYVIQTYAFVIVLESALNKKFNKHKLVDILCATIEKKKELYSTKNVNATNTHWEILLKKM